MDKSIEELFKEKNNNILRDKLVLDVGNNDDCLQLIVKNKIMLITQKTVKKINTLFREGQINYDVKTLTDLFDGYANNIESLVSEILIQRKNFLSEAIILQNKTSFVELSSIVEEFFKKFQAQFEPSLDKVIHISIREDLLSNYIFNDEIQKEQLIIILENYDSEIFRNISSAISERNLNLLNVFRETNEKVLELDNKTSAKVIEKK